MPSSLKLSPLSPSPNVTKMKTWQLIFQSNKTTWIRWRILLAWIFHSLQKALEQKSPEPKSKHILQWKSSPRRGYTPRRISLTSYPKGTSLRQLTTDLSSSCTMPFRLPKNYTLLSTSCLEESCFICWDLKKSSSKALPSSMQPKYS
jgi:hypothetical protein